MNMNWWHSSCRAISGLLLKIAGGNNEWYPLVRECAHFLGGAFIGTLTFLITLAWPGPWMWMIAGGLMYTALGIAEYYDVKGGQTRAKTICDLLYWGFGFIVMLSTTYLSGL